MFMEGAFKDKDNLFQFMRRGCESFCKFYSDNDRDCTKTWANFKPPVKYRYPFTKEFNPLNWKNEEIKRESHGFCIAFLDPKNQR